MFYDNGLSLKIARKQDAIIIVLPILLMCFDHVFKNWSNYKKNYRELYRRPGRRRNEGNQIYINATHLVLYYHQIAADIEKEKENREIVKQRFDELRKEFKHIECNFVEFQKMCEEIQLGEKKYLSDGYDFHITKGQYPKKMTPNKEAIFKLLEKFGKLAFSENAPSSSSIKRAVAESLKIKKR